MSAAQAAVAAQACDDNEAHPTRLHHLLPRPRVPPADRPIPGLSLMPPRLRGLLGSLAVEQRDDGSACC
jgi:hypothetical protein